MTDKKTFGLFIKNRRMEKNFSQKELAKLLSVTESAVSKWERGVSYPDITLVSDICQILDISEHELITASTDTDTRRMKHEARKFRVIRNTWFGIPTISYAIALLACFICNLAVNHTLSWFFIVLSALLCAYTFVPTLTCFFESQKFLAFCVSTYVSICLLLFTCAVYTDGMYWFLTSCIGVLIGYVLLFVPILLSKTKCSHYKFVFSFIAACVLTIVLLLCIHIWNPFRIIPSIWMTCYAFIPAILCTIICTLRLDAFLKTGICIASSTVIYYFTTYVVDVLFGTNERSYQVNFNDWQQCLEGNIHMLYLISLLLISFIFIGVGIARRYKNTL